jgi:hypothetical protein
VFHRPEAIFDIENDASGFFPVHINGALFNLGSNSGLEHVWTDTTVENGQTYYYAVTAYDRGFSGTVGGEEVLYFPSETTKFIFLDESGEITTDVNTVVITPGVQAAGYDPPVVGAAVQTQGVSSGQIVSDIVDPRQVPDDGEYTISFGAPDTTGAATEYSIFRRTDAGDSIAVVLNEDLSDPGTNTELLRLFDSYYDSLYGLPEGSFDTRSWFQTIETDVFDGMRMAFLTPRYPGNFISYTSGYTLHSDATDSTIINYDFDLISRTSLRFEGQPYYTNYRVTFHDEPVDTSLYLNIFGTEFPSVPLYFKVEDKSTGESPILVYDDRWFNDGYVHDETAVMFLQEMMVDGELDTIPTWEMVFLADSLDGQVEEPGVGDTLDLNMYIPFKENDLFTFQTEAAEIEKEEVDLSRISVYPNPYLGANTQEQRDPFLNSGRGERRITFIHLPDRCTIRIYNVRGELVDKIDHVSSMFDGTETWDLRTQDNLDIAYGIYVYHVESPYGEHVGKFAVVK